MESCLVRFQVEPFQHLQCNMLNKKEIRRRFRTACFERDNYACVKCGFQSPLKETDNYLNAHHITNREAMPNGGYVPENGITLCLDCHIKAEEFYSCGVAHKGYSVEELYAVINSNYDKAINASKILII